MKKKLQIECPNSHHLALDFGGIRGPVNKHDFVARIAISSGVPGRQKAKRECQKRKGFIYVPIEGN
jgi:hypothetical protein